MQLQLLTISIVGMNHKQYLIKMHFKFKVEPQDIKYNTFADLPEWFKDFIMVVEKRELFFP